MDIKLNRLLTHIPLWTSLDYSQIKYFIAHFAVLFYVKNSSIRRKIWFNNDNTLANWLYSLYSICNAVSDSLLFLLLLQLLLLLCAPTIPHSDRSNDLPDLSKLIQLLFFNHDDGTVKHHLSNLKSRYKQSSDCSINRRYGVLLLV